MGLTLYDNLLASAGTPHPEARPAIPDATRFAWTKVMHDLLRRADGPAGRVAAEFNADVAKLRMRVQRHGSALTAAWGVGDSEQLVAAGALLPGSNVRDDAAAVAGLRGCVSRLPFGDADFAGLAAERRPCLATLYADARWYDNARVELAATALAAAALYGPTGRLAVPPAAPPAQASEGEPDGHPGPWRDVPSRTLQFNFARPRMRLVMQLVAKKAAAARQALPGVHFRVFPAAEFLALPGVLRGTAVFDKLAASTWSIQWHDGQHDRLSFGELLGFLHQLGEIDAAFHEGTDRAPPAGTRRQNDSTWDSAGSNGGGVAVRMSRTLDTREIVADATVRRLFQSIALEPAPLFSTTSLSTPSPAVPR